MDWPESSDLNWDATRPTAAIATGSGGRIVRAACNVHARRKFEGSVSYAEDRKQWLRWYQQLYDIEDRGKRLAP